MSNTTQARRALSVPSTLILVAAGLGILLNLLGLLGVSQDAMLEQMRDGQGPGEPDPEQFLTYMRIGYGIVILVEVFVIWGALQMRRARSFTASLAAAILACLPVGSCCLIGLPAGVWAIVVLNRREVKDAFFADGDSGSDEDELDWGS